MNNPYTPPKSDVSDPKTDDGVIPSSPKVIGILFLIFGILGFISTIVGLVVMLNVPTVAEMQAEQGMSRPYVYGSMAISLLFIPWFIYIGYKLMKYKDIGRRNLNYYFIASLVFGTGSAIVQALVLDMDVGVVLQGLVGTVIGLVVMFICVYLMNRDKVKASLT